MNTRAKKIIYRSKPLLFVFFLLLLSLNSCKSSVTKPVVGDRYIEQLQDGKFSIIKIVSSNQKEVHFLKNDYRVSDTLYLDSIDIATNYSDSPQIVSIKKFKTLPLTYYKSINPKK